MGEKKITAIHMWNQYFQGRITDECDSMILTVEVQSCSEHLNDKSYMLELQRSKASGWRYWKELQDTVVWDD